MNGLKPEFKIGDIVTFNAYPGEFIMAEVVAVHEPGSKLFSDRRFIYSLKGIDQPLISDTSGVCIVQSEMYVDPTMGRM